MSVTTQRYCELANQHRPRDEQTLAREVLVLFGRGLTERDIGDTLRLDAETVRRLLVGAACGL